VVNLTRLHAALVTLGDGLVRGSAADLIAAETELSAIVRDLPALVEATRASRRHSDSGYTALIQATQDALRRARTLGRNVELTFREAEETGGRLASYGRSGAGALVAPPGALNARG
jgi:hypothetical protein